MPKQYLIPFQQEMDSKKKKILYSSTLFSEIPSPTHHPPQVKPNAQPGKSPEKGGVQQHFTEWSSNDLTK